MNEFLQRLRQRKLVQWTLAYVAAAFALLQGVDIVAQRFGWPEQTMRFVIIALSLGLFVTLVLAWYHGERGAQRINGAELLILALLLALGGGFLWQFSGASRAPVVKSAVELSSSVAIPEKSIAVLPFENLSDEKSNAYSQTASKTKSSPGWRRSQSLKSSRELPPNGSRARPAIFARSRTNLG